ncbi:shikimate dehydrogenase [Poseidonocella pacifica]|uniref:Shikimate dehydrogenase (NADP(+)) n=1 Tax=Poseidonocella pacifica TaxID=871651 RepID=A0A1I0XUT7_9RHOB|nr:shikimate dehydrogenase [Poseidonocella pacifica]SFB04694.1 shikimate dehydrogenase [Poseidonocella pacifica]
MTHSQIPLAGVMGDPVCFSKSPRLHGHWLSSYDIPGHYVPIHVTSENLEDVLRAMPRMGFVGANVTAPHKEAVLRLAHNVTDRATMIGAANTLIFGEDGRIHADNTDGYGFIENLRQGAPDWDPATDALVLGAGGAARAVLAALIDAGTTRIFLSNRTRIRAETLRETFGAKVQIVDWEKAAGIVDRVGLLVNTTSLGMTGKPELRFSLAGVRPETIVTDIVYSPLQTPLLQDAQARGCRTVDGLGMLLHQAVPGFERWFGVRPQVTPELRDLILK